MPPQSALPAPNADARAHSERVVAHIRAEIAAAGGWITFARYMQLALYAPGLGYYAAGAAKFGAAGDFVTAPEMTPLFARALAVQVAAILDATGRREILELGAGSGRLAADLLAALAARDALPSRYLILEPSPELRERQRATIARDAPAHAARVALARRAARNASPARSSPTKCWMRCRCISSRAAARRSASAASSLGDRPVAPPSRGPSGRPARGWRRWPPRAFLPAATI